jgi:hypothetical protein
MKKTVAEEWKLGSCFFIGLKLLYDFDVEVLVVDGGEETHDES